MRHLSHVLRLTLPSMYIYISPANTDIIFVYQGMNFTSLLEHKLLLVKGGWHQSMIMNVHVPPVTFLLVFQDNRNFYHIGAIHSVSNLFPVLMY